MSAVPNSCPRRPLRSEIRLST